MALRTKLSGILLFLLVYNLNSQVNFFGTASPIYIVNGSSDGKFMALADLENIYILSIDSFSRINTIKYEVEKTGIITEIRFHPKNDNSLWVKFSKYNGDLSPMPFFEYPQDSTFQYSVETGNRISALAGNIFLDFSTATDAWLVAYNDYLSYDYNGKTVHPSKKGKLIFFPGKKEYTCDKIVKGLKISPDNKYIAIACYDSINNGNEYYSLEIRDFETFQLISQRNLIDGKPSDLQFSVDSKTIYFNALKFMSSQIYLLNTEDLGNVEGRPIGDVIYRIRNGNLVGIRDSKAVIYNLQSSKEEQTIWANLTSLFSINGALIISDNEIAVFGETKKTDNLNDSHGGIEKLNLNDLEIYVKNENSYSQDTLFNPENLVFQDNQFNNGLISFNSKKDRMLSVSGLSLQVWNPVERKKLYELSFKNEFKAFIDDSSHLLILEKYEQIGYSDYKEQVIDLNTGIANYKIIKDSEYGGFDPNYKCACFAEPGKSSSWICSDFGNALWRISKDNLIPEKLVSFADDSKDAKTKIVDSWAIPETNEIIFQVVKEQSYLNGNESTVTRDSVLILDLSDLKLKRVRDLEKFPVFFPLKQNLYALPDTRQIKIFDVRLNKVRQVLDLKNLAFKTVVTEKEHAFFITKKEDSDSLIVFRYDLEENEFQKPFTIPAFSENYFAGIDGLNYVDSKIINSIIPGSKTTFRWNQPEPGFIFKNSLSLDGSGHALFGHSEFVDFATLSNKTVIPGYYKASLLKGDLTGKMIYINEYKYFTDNNSKPYFEFVIAPVDNYENASWRSEKFGYNKNEISPFDAIEISPNGNFAVFISLAGFSDIERGLYLLNLKTMKIIKFKIKAFKSFAFSPDESQIFLQGKNAANDKLICEIHNTENGELLNKLTRGFCEYTNKNQEVLSAEMEGVELLELHGELLIQKQFYYSRDWINVALQSKSGKWICGGSDDGFLYLWEIDKKSPVYKIKCGVLEIIRMEESDDKLFVFMSNGTLKIIDLSTISEIAEVRYEGRDEGNSVCWATPDGYFSMAREQLPFYHFVKNNKTYPIRSYEIFLNRPDIILKRIGIAEDKTIELYHAAFEKRISRQGLNDNFDFSDLERPEISIDNKDKINFSTQDPMFEFTVEAESSEYKMDELYTTVNGVPINGEKGLHFPGTNQFSRKISLELGYGLNSVVIKVKDSRGIESEPEYLEVFCTHKTVPHLYFIGIGVSDYKDSTMNLRFAEADVNLLGEFFDAGRNPENTSIKKVLNTEVTRENLLALKPLLQSTSVDDIVVISFSGHGILDKNYNFYFGTYDINFKNPAERGFNFNDIDWLLDSIPARRKLLLMDACHSGEIDESELVQSYRPMGEGVTGNVPRGATLISEEKNTMGLESSFELMQLLFADINRNNGSFIISAAGGMEYAYEGEKWGNGVFTYCFINAMRELRRNSSEEEQKVKISDLRKQTYSSVLKLTGGRQKPTSRTENTEWDWGL